MATTRIACPSLSPLLLLHRQRHRRSHSFCIPRRISASDSPIKDQPPSLDDLPSSDFEDRLAKIQRRVGGKKAERRKARKDPSLKSSSSSSKDVLLPPVPLQDPLSDGLRVELGFNSYTEKLNGRFAALGLAAVLLVELATGGSFLKYHDGAVIGLQAYFILAVSAIYIKFEKEKISVWPKS